MTTEEAEALVSQPKFVVVPIEWRVHNARLKAYRFGVPVVAPGVSRSVELIGTLGPLQWSYVLLVDRQFKVRRLHKPKHEHRNPDKAVVPPHHKHSWCESDADGIAYVPNDIDWQDHLTALRTFAAECRLHIQQYPPLLLINGRLL